mgnify:CR=1 FL=1|jgi:hypothetical protein
MMVFLSSFLSKSGGGVLKKKAEFFLRQKEKKKTSKSRFITSTKKGSGISLSSFPEAAGRRRV